MSANIDDTPVPRESTGRRVAKFAQGERFHKGMNWTTLAGVIGTAAMGYVADGQRGKADEQIASATARELAALDEWKVTSKIILSGQAEQIIKLREAVAALKVANAMLAQGHQRVQEVVADVDSLLGEEPAPSPAAGEAPKPNDDYVQKVKDSLLGR